MAIRGWICEGCMRGSKARPWACPTCRQEICDYCFHAYGHCKDCVEKFTSAQLIQAANAQGWHFEAVE